MGRNTLFIGKWQLLIEIIIGKIIISFFFPNINNKGVHLRRNGWVGGFQYVSKRYRRVLHITMHWGSGEAHFEQKTVLNLRTGPSNW